MVVSKSHVPKYTLEYSKDGASVPSSERYISIILYKNKFIKLDACNVYIYLYTNFILSIHLPSEQDWAIIVSKATEVAATPM